MKINTPILMLCFCLLLSCTQLLADTKHTNKNFRPLNDTGIFYGGNFPTGINQDCSGKILSGDTDEVSNKKFIQQQDCSTGTSAGINASSDTLDNALGNTSNKAAFSFHKVDSKGQKLPSKASNWQCVIDESSGLMWEVKHNDPDKNDFHHVGNKFTWYNSNPKNNGGNIGDWNRYGAQCQGYDEAKPRSYCHIEQFASRVNKTSLCGFNDWRVPTRSELSSIIHFGKNQPAIDAAFFPNTLNNFYWALNPIVERPIEAWGINFEFGFTSPLRKTDLRPVRLVRHSINKGDLAAAKTSQLKHSDDGDVVDTVTGLAWQRCLLGQSGDNCEIGTPQTLSWAEALTNPNTATEADNKGWRLPNIRELASIVELGSSNPAINSSLFPNSNANHIWSSSPYQFYSHYAWFLDFSDGIFIYGDRQDKKAVRLVREIPK